LKASEVQYAT